MLILLHLGRGYTSGARVIYTKIKMYALVILAVLATTPAIQGAVQLDSLMIFVTAHDSTVK